MILNKYISHSVNYLCWNKLYRLCFFTSASALENSPALYLYCIDSWSLTVYVCVSVSVSVCAGVCMIVSVCVCMCVLSSWTADPRGRKGGRHA